MEEPFCPVCLPKCLQRRLHEAKHMLSSLHELSCMNSQHQVCNLLLFPSHLHHYYDGIIGEQTTQSEFWRCHYSRDRSDRYRQEYLHKDSSARKSLWRKNRQSAQGLYEEGSPSGGVRALRIHFPHHSRRHASLRRWKFSSCRAIHSQRTSELDEKGDDNLKIAGLLYFHRITDPRLNESFNTHFIRFKKILSVEDSCRALLVTTMWDGGQSKTLLERKRELSVYWKKVEPLGRVVKFERSQDSAREIVQILLSRD